MYGSLCCSKSSNHSPNDHSWTLEGFSGEAAEVTSATVAAAAGGAGATIGAVGTAAGAVTSTGCVCAATAGGAPGDESPPEPDLGFFAERTVEGICTSPLMGQGPRAPLFESHVCSGSEAPLEPFVWSFLHARVLRA